MQNRQHTSLLCSRTPWLFGLFVLGLCVACLDFAERMEGRTVAGWELAHDGAVLMSCAEEPSSGNEPLWCANPDSPHCERGTPAPISSDPWLTPVFASAVDALVPPLLIALRSASATGAGTLLGHACAEGERLERPPRRA